MATTRDLGTYEMLWDCPSCETPKLLGKTHRYCPSCGSPQAADKRYFPPEGEGVLVKDHVYTGVDWQCPGCDTPNSNAAKFCASCGANREGDAKTVARKGAPAPAPAVPVAAKVGGIGLVAALGCGGVLLLGVTLLLVNMFWRSEVALVVTDRAWDRTVAVEELRERSEEAWCDAMPSGAIETRRWSAERSTKKVADGEDCKTANVDQGDGTFKQEERCTPRTRDEAVMGEKCAYTAVRWGVAETLRANGGDTTPAWPDTSALRGGTSIGARRAGAKAETYTVVFSDSASGDAQTCRLAEAKWAPMAKGSRWKSTAGVVTGGIDCDALVAATP